MINGFPIKREVGLGKNVYHLLRDEESLRKRKTVCEDYFAHRETNPVENLEDIEEANKAVDVRLCEKCRKKANREFDMDIKTCYLCSRINIILETEFREVNIPHFTNEDSIISLCGDCIEIIGKLN